MTMEQFELHRPKAARSLRAFARGAEVVTILPEYDDHCLFSAMLRGADERDNIAVLVSATHPMAMVGDEYTPGEPTWWWEEDLDG